MSEHEESPVKIHHTPCKNCVFAEYLMDSWKPEEKPTQVGCRLGRTEKFEAQGCLLEAEDEERQFYIVNGRNCKAFRDVNSEWAKKVPASQRAKMVRMEMTLLVDIIVYLGETTSTESLKKTIKSLKAQTLAAHRVLFLSNQSKVHRKELVTFLNKNTQGLADWKFTHIILKEENGDKVSRERSVDLSIQHIDGHYYAVASCGFEFPPTFVADLDKAINDNLERFSLLTANSSGEGQVVQTTVHKHPSMNGNGMAGVKLDEGVEPPGVGQTTTGEINLLLRNLAEKVQFHAIVDDQPYLVKSVTDVCPSFPS